MRPAALLLLALGALAAAGLARTAPSSVTLIQHGESRGGEVFGTFTATAEHFCRSGSWRDALGQRSGNFIRVERTHTCADGSGTVVFVYDGVTENLAGVGAWHIASGSGRYAGLRGRGTTSNVVTSHDPVRSEGTFVNTWRGVMDFDTAPPTARIGRPSVRVGKARSLRVRIRVTVRDDAAANRVAYVAQLYVPGRGMLGRRAGSRRPGVLTLDFVARAGAARRAVLEIALSDPVGNERKVSRSIHLRR